MKRLINSILLYTIRIYSHIWPYSRNDKFKSLKIRLYTHWISLEFKHFGEHSFIGYQLNLRGGKYISIGNRVGLGSRGILTAWDKYKGDSFEPKISIGNYTSIGEDFHITSINNIQIGNHVLMGKKVTITDNSHGKVEASMLSIPPVERPLFSKGPVIIEDGVWIGDKVTILANVRIGANSIIGANSVVTTDIPANTVACGVPTRVVKKI